MGKAREAAKMTQAQERPQIPYLKSDEYDHFAAIRQQWLITGVNFYSEGSYGAQYTLTLLMLGADSLQYKVSFTDSNTGRSAFCEAVMSHIYKETDKEPYGPVVLTLTESRKKGYKPFRNIDDVDEEEDNDHPF